MGDAQRLVWQQLHWSLPLDPGGPLQLLQRLATDQHRDPVVFEAFAERGLVTHLFGTTARQVRDVSQLVESLLPGVMLSRTERNRSGFRRLVRLRLRRPALALATARSIEAARAILAALASARGAGEQAALQVVVGAAVPPQLLLPRASDPTQPWFSVLAKGSREPSSSVKRALDEKSSQPGFHAFVRASATAKTDFRRVSILRALLASLRILQGPGTRIEFEAVKGSLDTLPRTGSVLLSAVEALALSGWPIGTEDLPGMASAHPKRLAPGVSGSDSTRVFAQTDAPGRTLPVGIAIEDALYHSLVLGPTGAGKSTSLLNLIVADMKAGRSVVVIDPKNDLVHDVLERVPEHRQRDVVVIDPTQPHPVGLNPVAAVGSSPELVADGILNILRELFPSAFGPRTSDILHASLLTLAHRPGATLAWLPRLFTDTRFRRNLLRTSPDMSEDLRDFWEQFDSLGERQQAQHIGPALSRLRQFLLRPSLRRVLDQPEPRFDLHEVFDKPRIVLVPINSGVLGNDASRLLGSLLVSQLWQLTLARSATRPDSRAPVSLYIDEAQEFVRLGGDLADALARSRSLGVAWHLAHQYRAQMSAEMRAAIDTNARNKIVFTLGPDDARAMAAMAPELTAEDFMALPQHAVYAKLMRGGRQLGWVSAAILPAPKTTSDPLEIVARSQERYGAPPKQAASPDKSAVGATDARTDHDVSQHLSNSPVGRKRRSS